MASLAPWQKFREKINARTIQSGLGERKTNKQKHDKLNWRFFLPEFHQQIIAFGDGN